MHDFRRRAPPSRGVGQFDRRPGAAISNTAGRTTPSLSGRDSRSGLSTPSRWGTSRSCATAARSTSSLRGGSGCRSSIESRSSTALLEAARAQTRRSPNLPPTNSRRFFIPGGGARIIAPAGSGKTRVLTERARLLLTGLGPSGQRHRRGRLQPKGGGRTDRAAPPTFRS